MIQPWMSPAALRACPAAKAKGNQAPFEDSQMFNAMIFPLSKLRLSAVLWHQGEENSGNPVEYNCFFKSMISDWRATFKQPLLPFSFVQLQPCGIPPAQRYGVSLLAISSPFSDVQRVYIAITSLSSLSVCMCLGQHKRRRSR